MSFRVKSVCSSGVFAVKSVSVIEGDSVSLNSDLTEMMDDDVIQWRFGDENTLIAEIDVLEDRMTVYEDVPDGRFRDRLKLDDQTGSLTITHTTTEHEGVYELQTNSVRKIFVLAVYDEVKSVSVTEGDSVSLNSDLTEIKDDDVILWRFGDENTLIAEIDVLEDRITVYDDVPDGRFRDRLKLDDQTGSLTITHTTTEHTGVYRLEMTRNLSKSFNLTVYSRLPVPVINRDCSSSSSSCSLVCSSSVLSVCDATLSWYAGMSVLSSISVCDLSISLSLPLDVEYEDKNTYSCVLNNPISNQTTHLDIRHTSAEVHCCGSTEAVIRLVLSAVVGVATVILLVYDIRSTTNGRSVEESTAVIFNN
ncbi:hypothetical protein F2P79_019256 [Pimephales promelas]|nr:hypothetical protein F2P79_019256 [Pimephales promelas]